MSQPAHDVMRMVAQSSYPRKHTGLGGRRWNVWHRVYECPVCRVTRDALMNPMKGRGYFCEGTRVYLQRLRT